MKRSVMFILLEFLGAGAGASAREVAQASHVEASPSGDRVLVISDRTRLQVFSPDGTAVTDLPVKGPIVETAFSPDGRRLAVCVGVQGLIIVEEGGQSASAAPESAGMCSHLSWTNSGQLAYVLKTVQSPGGAVTETYQAKLWDSQSGKVKLLHTSTVNWARQTVQPPSPGGNNGLGAPGNMPPSTAPSQVSPPVLPTPSRPPSPR